MSLKLEEVVGKKLTEEQFDEAAGKKDACYHKVKARYDVWPSAYASGALVKCRKVGAKNWGNKSKKEGLGEVSDVQKRKIYKKAFGKEYDDSKRKQTPLPLDIAYKVALNKLKKNEGDIESRELKLYIDNDSQLYNSRFMPIMKNLSKKMKKGNFDKKLAIKGFMYLVDDGAKKYVKDFGGNAKDMFSKKDRIAVASDLADEFEDAYKNKEYSFMENVNEGYSMRDLGLSPFFKKLNPMQRQAVSIALVMGGNMSGAVKAIEKIKKGLSNDKKVKNALRMANEGLGDMVGKSIGKYNKKRKKNIDALKKLKKKKPIKLRSKSGMGKISHLGMENIDEARGTCWVGYQQKGMKKKGDRMVPNCVKETIEIFYEEAGKGHGYTFEYVRENQLDSRTGKLDKKIKMIKSKENQDDQDKKNIEDLMKMKNRKESVNEAEYQGRKVKLGKIMQGDTKKFKVYVKNPKGNVVKVNFGQGGGAKGGTMRIRKSNPKARANFRARHNCDNPGPRHKARYWSCRKW